MKKLFLLSVFCLFFACFCNAQDGINFENITYQEALAKAKKTNKLVFIDCYTKTCGPCKFMAKNIFPLKECGDYFNSRFVSIMRDVEEGDGVEIKKKYQVAMYPTYLFLNPDGTVHTLLMCGKKNTAKEFVDEVKKAMEEAAKK